MKKKRGSKKALPATRKSDTKEAATKKSTGGDGPASSAYGGLPERDLRKNLGC